MTFVLYPPPPSPASIVLIGGHTMAGKKEPLSKEMDNLIWSAAVLGAEFAFMMAEQGHNLQQIKTKLRQIFREESKSI